MLSRGQGVLGSSGLKSGCITRMTSENGQPSFPQSKLLLLKFKAEALIPETKTYEKSTRSTHADLEDLSKFSTYVKILGFNHSRPFCKASTAPISQGVRELRAENICRIF